MSPDLQCTFWPEGWWQHCCIAHDLGSSDMELFFCVVDSSPNAIVGAIIGAVMIMGVTLFKPIWNSFKGKNK